MIVFPTLTQIQALHDAVIEATDSAIASIAAPKGCRGRWAVSNSAWPTTT